MEGIRLRLLDLVEWVAAAACVLAVLLAMAVASAGRQFVNVRPVIPVNAASARPAIVPANLRPGAILVPDLVLPDGKRISTGQPASSLDALGPLADTGPASTERDADGQRDSRSYRYAGMEFVVVTANDRIVAIYR